MKLLSLNLWGGKLFDPLVDFLESKRGEIDVFCFQEMYFQAKASKFTKEKRLTLFQDVKNILPNFDAFFYPTVGSHYGVAMFAKSSLDIIDEGDVFVRGNRGEGYAIGGKKDHTRNVQFVELAVGGGNLFVNNVHGMWHESGKGDVPERITQSENMVEMLEGQSGPKIMCGDFNLRPDTKSMEIIESAGLRNLTTEYGVTDTRTSFYEKEERFADYVLVSDEIAVNYFQVLEDEVSDHAPLYLDFSVT